jgi:hypothetical protein
MKAAAPAFSHRYGCCEMIIVVIIVNPAVLLLPSSTRAIAFKLHPFVSYN